MQSMISPRMIALALLLCLAACDDATFRVTASPQATQAVQAPDPTWDYENMINPATNIRTSSPYDFEDLYRDKNGFALPGDAQIR